MTTPTRREQLLQLAVSHATPAQTSTPKPPDPPGPPAAPPAEPIPAPIQIVTGNISSDAPPVVMAARVPASLIAAVQEAASAAGASRNAWIVAAMRDKIARQRGYSVAAPGGEQMLTIKAPAAVAEQVKRHAAEEGITAAHYIVQAIDEALHPQPDPATDRRYAGLPQPRRDPYSGQLIPPHDSDGLPIWRVRVAPGERTCCNCGETFTPRTDTVGRPIGFCPLCCDLDEAGRRRRLYKAPPSVPSEAIFRPDEYEIAGRRRA